MTQMRRILTEILGRKSFWQATQHPVGIYTEKFWGQKMDLSAAKSISKGVGPRTGRLAVLIGDFLDEWDD